MSDPISDDIPERQDFYDISTKELKGMYKDSHTIMFLCCLWLGGLILMTIGFLIFGFLSPPEPDKKEAILFLSIIFLLPFHLLYLPGIIGGFKRTGWGHTWGMGICILMCFGFPIGTILGFIGLNAYKRKELFGKQEILHSELKKEYLYRKHNSIN